MTPEQNEQAQAFIKKACDANNSWWRALFNCSYSLVLAGDYSACGYGNTPEDMSYYLLESDLPFPTTVEERIQFFEDYAEANKPDPVDFALFCFLDDSSIALDSKLCLEYVVNNPHTIPQYLTEYYEMYGE